MLSSYFKVKTSTKKFIEDTNNLIDSLKDKKIIIYGAGEGFLDLRKKFQFEKLNIVAISDIKFEEKQKFKGLNAIPPQEIKEMEFDAIIVTQEKPKGVLAFLRNRLLLEKEEIITLFNEEIPDEANNFNYLAKYNFEKSIKSLEKKLKNKKIVLYGTGALFQVVKRYYDLSKFDIIAVSDMKYDFHEENETFMGYKVCSRNEIKDLKPDYVIISTAYYVSLAQDLYEGVLKNTGIKIAPLLKKTFIDTMKEIWNS